MKERMRAQRFGFALFALSAMGTIGLGLSACGTQGQTGGAGGTSGSASSSGGGSDAGPPPACDTIRFTNDKICEPCMHQHCCPELIACEEASPFCPYVCAPNPNDPGCAPFLDLAVAVRNCWAIQCECECSGHNMECDAGPDADANVFSMSSSGSGSSGADGGEGGP